MSQPDGSMSRSGLCRTLRPDHLIQRRVQIENDYAKAEAYSRDLFKTQARRWVAPWLCHKSRIRREGNLYSIPPFGLEGRWSLRSLPECSRRFRPVDIFLLPLSINVYVVGSNRSYRGGNICLKQNDAIVEARGTQTFFPNA